jgi:tetratricopeptide (TPR) repeat protein
LDPGIIHSIASKNDFPCQLSHEAAGHLWDRGATIRDRLREGWLLGKKTPKKSFLTTGPRLPYNPKLNPYLRKYSKEGEMMQHSHKCLLFIVIIALSLVLTIPVFAQSGSPSSPSAQLASSDTVKGGALMPEDVYTPIAKGYELIRDGKYEAAKKEFDNALKLDPNNPFALNNLAVIEEREGNHNKALAILKDALVQATDYKDQIAQPCLASGSIIAVRPMRGVAKKSQIVSIIGENLKKIKANIEYGPHGPGDHPEK